MQSARIGKDTGFAEASIVDEDDARLEEYFEVFSNMTAKRHDVFRLLAENRTGKDIAHRLGITESAVVKRVESIRALTGFPPRAELGRAYGLYLRSQVVDFADADAAARSRQFAQAQSTWQRVVAQWLFPGAFVGPEAGLNRIAAMVVIAAGMLLVALASLGIVQAVAGLQ